MIGELIPNFAGLQMVTGIVTAWDNETPGQLVGQPRYTINTVFPGGGSSSLPGQQAGWRVRPADVEADGSIMVGQEVFGLYTITGRIFWLFFDPDKVEYCGDSLQSQPMMLDPITGLPIPVPPITPGQTTATPPEPSPPIGGDGGAA